MYKLGVIEKSILNSCVDDLVSKFCHRTGEPRLMVTGQLSTMATFFCPQGGHCREVQLSYCISTCVLHILKKISRLSHRHRGEKM